MLSCNSTDPKGKPMLETSPAIPRSQPQPQGKPLLTASEQVAHLKSRGITFDLCTEAEAANYLECGNNYLRAASYRKLYPMKLDGPHAGGYIGLDFAALMAPSSADRTLRSALREICIDVEHFARLDLINRRMYGSAHCEDKGTVNSFA